MKLAEALQMRAELQNKSDSLQKRVCANMKVLQGEEPLEDPKALLSELFSVHDRLSDMIGRINAKNNAVTLPDGRTLAQALIERDALMKKRKMLTAITESVFSREYSIARSMENKVTILLSMHDLHAQIEDMSRQFRQLDSIIQTINWQTEL